MGAVPPPIQPQAPPRRNNTTLTVVIVLVVGACLIVPVLGALLFPVFSQAKLSAQRNVTMRQAGDISRYLHIYAMDNEGLLPHQFETDQDIFGAVSMYAGGPGDMFDTHNPQGGKFIPNSFLASVRIDDVLAPEGTILIFESAPWDGGNGRVASFLNGQVLYIKPFSESQVFPPRLATTRANP